jgi:hypothetical protein
MPPCLKARSFSHSHPDGGCRRILWVNVFCRSQVNNVFRVASPPELHGITLKRLYGTVVIIYSLAQSRADTISTPLQANSTIPTLQFSVQENVTVDLGSVRCTTYNKWNNNLITEASIQVQPNSKLDSGTWTISDMAFVTQICQI